MSSTQESLIGPDPTNEYLYPYPWARLRSIRNHPFIYQRMIDKVSPMATNGDVLAVFDRQNRFYGHGFYNQKSQIGLRIISHQTDPVDDDFFRQRIRTAIDWRNQTISDRQANNTYRLFHSEGDGISGLIADRYDDWISMEVFSLGVFRRLELFKKLFTELTGITNFSIRADERVQRLEGFTIRPDHSSPPRGTVTVHENGLRFRVDLQSGHKTGFFCDQRDNRQRLAQRCQGQRVLDVCCYTGGFSIYAAAGKAKEVTGVDLDETAVELAIKNSHLNNARIKFVHADGFAYIRQMQQNNQSYDVIVLDPPKFIAGKDDWTEGLQKYTDLNTLAISVLKPGGLLLTCSCSGMVTSEQLLGFVQSAANRHRRRLQIVEQTGPAPDHPVMTDYPESAYLKALWARVF